MEFKGIDLSTKYIHPSTWEWLAESADDMNSPIEAYVYDSGYGILIWTYSADGSEELLPVDLRNIVETALEREWRFIVLDCDGADCELFPSFEEEWRR